MYITGGSGIHGFTFILFVGLITGTYSSIAIASPLLLLQRRGAAAPSAPARVGTPATT
jgi:preprotein translocase subunit SecF